MFNFLLIWLVSAISLIITAKLVPGIEITNFTSAILASGLIGFVNATIRPIITILTLPLTLLSLGLFLLIINAISLSLAGWLSGVFNIGFKVVGFWPAFFGAIVLSLISGFLSRVAKVDQNNDF